MRRLALASAVLLVSFGVAGAEEFFASITKVEDGKVTFHKLKKKEKGEAMTLPAADKVKVVKGKFDFKAKTFEVTEEIKDGLKAEMFQKIDSEKGVTVRIITDDDGKKITEIRIGQGGKKKKA